MLKRYQFTARKDEETFDDIIEASDEAEARRNLEEQGYWVMLLKPADQAKEKTVPVDVSGGDVDKGSPTSARPVRPPKKTSRPPKKTSRPPKRTSRRSGANRSKGFEGGKTLRSWAHALRFVALGLAALFLARFLWSFGIHNRIHILLLVVFGPVSLITALSLYLSSRPHKVGHVLGLVFSALAVVAAVVPPIWLSNGFDRFRRRSQTLDAQMNLRQLADGVARYHDQNSVFPDSAPRSPSDVPCGEGEGELFDGSHPSWRAIDFDVSTPTLFSYQVESNGVGASAVVTVYAFGDLDCDGDLSTFSRVVGLADNFAEIGPVEETNPIE